MAKTKISEFSATPANNTDIDSINIAEGCAPSGINDAIRELMAQLKDFQTGAVGDSFNGPIGTSTAAAGAFTTLAASGAVTLSGGTANGVTYLNGSKVLTSGSALQFDGANLGVGVTPSIYWGGNKGLDVGSVGCGLTSRQNNEINLGQNAAYNTYATNGVASRFTLANDGAFYWYQAASGTAGNTITFTQALSLERDKSLALKGAVSQSGTGITFPATQSASSDANTLDDYEEGTWTPSFFGTTTQGTPTQTQQKGFYTKVGRSVSIMGYINMTNKGGMAGNLQISGLPFTTLNASGAAGAFAIAEHGGLTAAAGRTSFGLEQQTNATNITVYSNGTAVDSAQQSIINTADASYIVFAGTYFV